MSTLAYQSEDCHVAIKHTAPIHSFFSGSSFKDSRSPGKLTTNPNDQGSHKHTDQADVDAVITATVAPLNCITSESVAMNHSDSDNGRLKSDDQALSQSSIAEAPDGESVPFLCPVCEKDLSVNSLTFRTMHVTLCCSASDSTQDSTGNRKGLAVDAPSFPKRLARLAEIQNPVVSSNKRTKVAAGPALLANRITNYFSAQKKS